MNVKTFEDGVGDGLGDLEREMARIRSCGFGAAR